MKRRIVARCLQSPESTLNTNTYFYAIGRIVLPSENTYKSSKMDQEGRERLHISYEIVYAMEVLYVGASMR